MKRIIENDLKIQFGALLLKWNKRSNKRQMPWKGEKDPYKIWLSEIILQQTRVEQGTRYYHDLLRAFPDIHQLANAPDKKVYKLWEGLGYYSRCKNLLITARYISKERKGNFPDTYEEIKQLRGIGPYTASAIASFAFNLPYAVVDGNVFRILARVFGVKKPIDSTEGRNFFSQIAQQLLDKKYPGIYNQAIMDFGAITCKPAPRCEQCIFKKNCFAFLHNKIKDLPVKEKKIQIKKRWFYYLVIEHNQKMAIHQRTGKDIWQQLYEFPLIESDKVQDLKTVLLKAEKRKFIVKAKYKILSVSPLHKQQLSHQLIQGQFIRVVLKQKPSLSKGWYWVNKKELATYTFPKFINQFLNK
ncbi:MAG TPA: A/G-specific adenine glycosylase [Chitinophagaceae bacterium]|nr:A/G-specific adenine glycosylase [Chitinophagaceae bacterium]